MARDLYRVLAEYDPGMDLPALASRVRLSLAHLEAILDELRLPTPAEIKRTCRSVGEPCWRKVTMLATRPDGSPQWHRLAATPTWQELKQIAEAYPLRRTHRLRYVDADHPFRTHTLGFTMNVPDVHRLLKRLDILRGRERLELTADKSKRYEVSYRSTATRKRQWGEKGGYEKAVANVLIQVEPTRRQLEDNPNTRKVRLALADVYDRDPLGRELLRFVLDQGADDFRINAFDLGTNLLTQLRDLGFRLPHSRPRRRYDDVLFERIYSGDHGHLAVVAYENHADRGGGTRLEIRDHTRFDASQLAQRFFPLDELELWDLRLTGVYDPDLRPALARAQVGGVRELCQPGVPSVVQGSDEHRSYLLLENEVGHPKHVLTPKTYQEELRRLASWLGVPPSFFGL